MQNTSIKNTLLCAALGLTLGLASCSGETSAKDLNNEGETALQSMDYDGAKASYEKALAALGEDTSSADYKTAKLGVIESLAHLNAGDCVTAFMALAADGGLNAKDYSLIGGILAGADSVNEGVTVAAAGREVFPDDAGLDSVLKALVEKAKKTGNSEAMGALAGLGYL
jgi:hypothetical protein